MESETKLLLLRVEVRGQLHLQNENDSVVVLLIDESLISLTIGHCGSDLSGGRIGLRRCNGRRVSIDLLCIDVDLFLWHLDLDDNLVFLSEHLLLSQLLEADLGPRVVGISDHQEQVNVRVRRLKLSNTVNRYFGNNSIHKHLHALCITWGHDFLRALLAFLDALGQQLESEWVEIVPVSWLSVDILEALVQLRHLVDIKILLKGLVERHERVFIFVAFSNNCSVSLRSWIT